MPISDSNLRPRLAPGRLVTLPALAACVVALSGCTESQASGTLAPPSASAVTPAASAPVASATAAVREPPRVDPPAPIYEVEELPEAELEPKTLEEQRGAMLRRMRALGVIGDEQQERLATMLAGSKRLGQGNPAVARHPMTRSECIAQRRAAGAEEEQKPLCGAPFMAPLYDPATEREQDARVCIDRYEFPGLPCEYPMTWVTTAQAMELCRVIGKRLCDAHEWEGACAGALRPPGDEYAFGKPRQHMRGLHNLDRDQVWAYGPRKNHGRCGTSSQKSKSCTASGWKQCGSNTFPAGAFVECRSPFGVYDLHGNAAEHMNLPLLAKDLGTEGGFGVPEMKGSWFIFSRYEAHLDDCRWRAPSWHDEEGRNHSNYHLGFRCCKDVPRP